MTSSVQELATTKIKHDPEEAQTENNVARLGQPFLTPATNWSLHEPRPQVPVLSVRFFLW